MPSSPMTLKRYLTAIILVTITLIAVVCGILLVVMVQNTYLEGLRQRGIELAQVLADDQHVIEAVIQSNQGHNVSLQDRIEPLRAHTDASFIVIVNQQGIRLSHPIPERVGKAFIGDDVWVSLQQGIPHTSIDTGSLGRAIRNFAPIVHENKVVGAVSIGYLTHSVTELLYTHYRTALLWIAFLYVCAVTLAMLLVSKLKRTFLEFEPEEIVEKFKANELVLDSIREGVIAIDRQHLVTAINRTAMAWLYPDTPEKNVLHRPLAEVSQTLSLVLLNSQEQAYKQTLALGKERFSVTVYPLSLHAPQSGYLILLTPQQDQGAVEQDLIQTRAYANHLRTKTHEYGNKLNVLSGLLQAGQHQDAIDYLQQESDRHQHLLGTLVKGIDNSPIAGMLMAKYNKASELGVQFILDSDSRLGHYTTGINDDLISLIGNLVDNALYAAWLNRQRVAPEVVLFLSDRNNHLMVTVEDNGAGIAPEVAEHMLDFGVTSKQGDEQNGMGLYLVKRIVDRYHGSLDWERTPEHTTAFSVYIDKRQLT